MRISKRFVARAKTNLRKYQRLLESARARDVNESDTAVLVSDFLAEVLGWDKYSEVTTEFAIRSTFCDLAVKVDGQVLFLIEVKSIGTDLKENHLRQAIDYAANAGVEWVLLTNGLEWHAHRIRFEQPIQHDEVFTCAICDPATKPAELLGKLFLMSREAVSSSAMAKYWQQREATSRFVIAQMLLDATILGAVRRRLRKQFAGIRVTEEDLRARILEEVFKRDVVEGDRATAAERLVKRAARKRSKDKTAPVTSELPTPAPAPAPPAAH